MLVKQAQKAPMLTVSRTFASSTDNTPTRDRLLKTNSVVTTSNHDPALLNVHHLQNLQTFGQNQQVHNQQQCGSGSVLRSLVSDSDYTSGFQQYYSEVRKLATTSKINNLSS